VHDVARNVKHNGGGRILGVSIAWAIDRGLHLDPAS
jgi:hypothetical protein